MDRREDNGEQKLTEWYLGQLHELVSGQPTDYGERRPTWTRELLVKIMARETGTWIHVTTMSRALKQIGARRGPPRPVVRCPWPKRAKNRRIRQIRALLDDLPDGEVVVYEDEVDIHLNPKIGLDWMNRGQQKEVVTPGQNEKRYLAGAMNAKTRLLTVVEGKQISEGDWPTYRHDNARSGCAAGAVSARLKEAWRVKLGGKLTPPVLAGKRLFLANVSAHAVYCLDAATGKTLWRYTAGGPVDSPPTLHGPRAYFGCTDGSVYCLRAVDGAIVWRFHAAPYEKRVVSYGTVQSAWPIHGSVLIAGGAVYFAAGRSSFLDGGMYLFGLDAETGAVRHRAHLDGPWPDLSKPSNRAHEMDGCKNDILVGNGSKLFLTQNVFDRKLQQLPAPKIAKYGARKTDRHLVATGGFLDDSGFDRLYWMYADRWPGLYVAPRASKAGQILVFDDRTTYALHTFNRKFSRSPYFQPGAAGHDLVADPVDNEPVLPQQQARRERGSMARTAPPKWTVKIPVRARAMVLAQTHLFLAGPPDVIDPKDPHGAFEGRKGARLWVVSTKDGRRLAEYVLDRPPVFDGLIAAHGRLYLAMKDGSVICMGAKE